jgi:hypothetical protein
MAVQDIEKRGAEPNAAVTGAVAAASGGAVGEILAHADTARRATATSLGDGGIA